jgi:hypothetical protein
MKMLAFWLSFCCMVPYGCRAAPVDGSNGGTADPPFQEQQGLSGQPSDIPPNLVIEPPLSSIAPSQEGEDSGLGQTQDAFSTASETFDLRRIFLPPQTDSLPSEAGMSDLAESLGGWTSVANECLVKFGDWDCSMHNWVVECDGYWDELRLAAHSFELVGDDGPEPYVSLDSQLGHPEIPADVPMVQAFGMETLFVSPTIDISGDGDVFEFEYRVSAVDEFAYQIVLSDESGQHLLHEFHPPSNTGINHPSTNFEPVSIDLEDFYSECPSCPPMPMSQSEQASISIGVLYNSGMID